MKKITVLVLIIFCVSELQAQFHNKFITQAFTETTCATSNQATIGNFSIYYTIGEMVLVNDNKIHGLFITNGLYQPVILPNPLDGQVFLDGEILIYPNPTKDFLKIQYNLLQAGKISVQLYDATGKKILAEEISNNSFYTSKYDLTKYAHGMYALVLRYVSNDGTIIKKGTYKIIKTL